MVPKRTHSFNSRRQSICRTNNNSNIRTICSHRETYRVRADWEEALLLVFLTMVKRPPITMHKDTPWFKKTEEASISSSAKRWEKWFLASSSSLRLRLSTILSKCRKRTYRIIIATWKLLITLLKMKILVLRQSYSKFKQSLIREIRSLRN